MVFRCCPQHGWAADINVFDGVLACAVGAGNRLGEGVEIHDHEINRRNTVLLHLLVIRTASTEQSRVDPRVQRFYPPVHHFWKTGVLRDLHDPHAMIAQQSRGAAGGKNLHLRLHQTPRQFDDTGLV